MKNLTALFVLILCVSLTPLVAQNRIGYAPYYRNYNSNFDFSKYTHIHYFTIWPKANGGFIFPQNDSTAMANQFKSIADKAHLGGVKMIMTFGGTAANGSKYMGAMAADPTARALFISNVIALASAWNLDGIDIDWEWSLHTESQTNVDGYTNLMTDLRVAATANNLTLSTAVAPSSWFGVNSNPVAVNKADYVVVMSYGYNGSWSSTANHHAPLDKTISVGLNYWTGQGISKSKLNIGIPFYGESYKNCSSPGGTYTSNNEYNYAQIKALIANGYTVVENNNTGTYCYSLTNNEIVFFDSPANVEYKMQYAQNNNYGGIAIWEIGQDANQELSTAIDNATTTSTLDTKEISFANIHQNSNELTIITKDPKVLFCMFDLKGNMLKELDLSAGNTKINISNLPDGCYVITMSNGTKSVSTKMIRQ